MPMRRVSLIYDCAIDVSGANACKTGGGGCDEETGVFFRRLANCEVRYEQVRFCNQINNHKIDIIKYFLIPIRFEHWNIKIEWHSIN